MEAPAFWRDLQAQFLALPDVGGGRQLDAIQGDDDSNTWSLRGGPVDPVERASLHDRFSALAKRGGIGIGATGDQALSAWLNLLLQKSPRAYTTHLESIESTATDPRDLLVSQIQVLGIYRQGLKLPLYWSKDNPYHHLPSHQYSKAFTPGTKRNSRAANSRHRTELSPATLAASNLRLSIPK